MAVDAKKMLALAEILGKPAVRDEFLKYCVYCASPEPVLVSLNAELAASPTKSKALALYDTFVDPKGDMSVNISAKVATAAALMNEINTLRKNKDEREAMNGLARLFTSKDSKKPADGLFQAVLEECFANNNDWWERVFKMFDPKKKVLLQKDPQSSSKTITDDPLPGKATDQMVRTMKSWEGSRSKLEKAGFTWVKAVK